MSSTMSLVYRGKSDLMKQGQSQTSNYNRKLSINPQIFNFVVVHPALLGEHPRPTKLPHSRHHHPLCLQV